MQVHASFTMREHDRLTLMKSETLPARHVSRATVMASDEHPQATRAAEPAVDFRAIFRDISPEFVAGCSGQRR
jgi:hypothetical protein